MGSGSLETNMGFNNCVNQNPIRLDMAVPAAGKIAAQWMIFVFRREWLALNQKVENRLEFRQILAALFGAFDVFLELRGSAEGSHRPRSA